MSKFAPTDLVQQFKDAIQTHTVVTDPQKIINIGLEALSNGTLDTRTDGADLLCELVVMESTLSGRTIRNLFDILIKSGASINGLNYMRVTPLVNAILYNTPIMFHLLMSSPSIDLNMPSYNINWTPLMDAVFHVRYEMVKSLCKRFYEIDFRVVTTHWGERNMTAEKIAIAGYSSEDIRTFLNNVIHNNLPNYKNAVNNLLLSDLCFPKVLIPIIGLYAFF